MPSSATHQCPSVSATSQCCQSVSPIGAHKCCLSVPIIAAYQCPSVLHISAASSVRPHECPPVPLHQCHLISAHQCCLSVQPHQRTSVKEKITCLQNF
ncbi:unnamed protein product, partial [Staurois parvus]